MKIKIVGDGAFGSFLKRELPAYDFEISDTAEVVILAVPISAYDECGALFKDKHLINVCSVQKPSTDILLKHTERVTSIHPLFGARTPVEKRFSILTRLANIDNDTWYLCPLESEFLRRFRKFSIVNHELNGKRITPEDHDLIMAKTHVAAVNAAKQLKIYTERAQDIPDEFIPHSFRKVRELVKTLDDMPVGTMQSIMANTFC